MVNYENITADKVSSIKIRRNLSKTVLRNVDIISFIADFPDYRFAESNASTLIRSSDTRGKISGSEILDQSTIVSQFLPKIMQRGAYVASHRLELGVKGLSQVTVKKGVHRTGPEQKIQVILDDPEGILEEERQFYLANLANVAGVRPSPEPYVPHVTFGRVSVATGEIVPKDAMQRLESYIPYMVELGKPKPLVFRHGKADFRYRY